MCGVCLRYGATFTAFELRPNFGKAERSIRANGERRTISEWSELSGIPVARIHYRLHTGWTADRAVTQPLDYSRQRKDTRVTTKHPCGPMSLVELRYTRGLAGVRSVTALYRCPTCPAENTVVDQVPQQLAMWRLYRNAAGLKRWHLWIGEMAAPSGWEHVSPASACGSANTVTHAHRFIPAPSTRERVCQLCRCIAVKFGIDLPKGVRR